MIQDFLTIHSLKDYKPDLSSPIPFGFVDSGKGGTHFLNQGPSFGFVALIEFSPEKGPRGNHAHYKKKESFYIISGKLKARYWLKGQEALAVDFVHGPGDYITILPGLYHVFEGVEPTLALEMSPQPFDRSDVVYASSDS